MDDTVLGENASCKKSEQLHGVIIDSECICVVHDSMYEIL